VELLTIVLGSIVTVGGFFAGLLTGRRLKVAEAREKEAQAKSVELTNVGSEIEIYKGMLNDLKAHNEQLRQINVDMIALVQPLRERVTHLEAQVRRHERENSVLKGK